MHDRAKGTRLNRIFPSNPTSGKNLQCYVGDTSLQFVPGRGVGRRNCKSCLPLLGGWGRTCVLVERCPLPRIFCLLFRGVRIRLYRVLSGKPYL